MRPIVIGPYTLVQTRHRFYECQLPCGVIIQCRPWNGKWRADVVDGFRIPVIDKTLTCAFTRLAAQFPKVKT